MKLGCCLNLAAAGLKTEELDLLPAVAAAGYDYIELSGTGIAALNDEDFGSLRGMLECYGMQCLSINSLFPSEYNLITDVPSKFDASGYYAKVLDRAARLGASYIGFGSGAARRVPMRADTEAFENLLAEQISRMAEKADKADLTLLLEPLRSAETNFVNTIGEALKLVRRWKVPKLKLLADYYHMVSEREPFDILTDASDIVVHAHIASENGRCFPRPDEMMLYRPFFDALHKAGYKGAISVEAYLNGGIEELSETATFLKVLDCD